MITSVLPLDNSSTNLLGRVFVPELAGPSIVTIKKGEVFDITTYRVATSRDVCELQNPTRYIGKAMRSATSLGSLEDIILNSDEDRRDFSRPWLLSPIDLQAVKAAGVTFVTSLLERVIEEKARGDSGIAVEIRKDIENLLGDGITSLTPGSGEASAIKKLLVSKGVWSQYLEVGIGPDAEIFTKCQPMSSVGFGSSIGILPTSSWNNPEPEIVLVISGSGRIVGATLGNDLNLRDFEGRSALLLGKAKDNNASASLGPFIRLFDQQFTLDDVRNADLKVEVSGIDGFKLEGISSMKKISRDPEDLVRATLNPNHQYPDGFALFLGTMFAPTEDRDTPGEGFTHEIGDLVTISTGCLGSLENRVKYCADCAPWEFGVGSLLQNLSDRKLF